MAAVYERQKTKWAGSFASDQAALTIGGNANVPLGIVQNVQVSFAQQVARIYDVSNGGVANGTGVPVFYVGGRTQGQATIARVLGPQSGSLSNFYNVLGNVCQPQDVAFTFQGGCETSGAGNISGLRNTARQTIAAAKGNVALNRSVYTLEACVMTNLSIDVNNQDMIVNENIVAMFANLNCN